MKSTIDGTLTMEFDAEVTYERDGDGHVDHIVIEHAWLRAPVDKALPDFDMAPYLAEWEQDELRKQAQKQL